MTILEMIEDRIGELEQLLNSIVLCNPKRIALSCGKIINDDEYGLLHHEYEVCIIGEITFLQGLRDKLKN